MNQLSASDYCKEIDQKVLLNEKLIPTITILEDNTPMVSLKDTGFDLMFEPSIQKGYAYLVRESMVNKIKKISEVLSQQDKTLIIRSAWRSFEHQRRIWNNKVDFMKRIHPDMDLNEIENKVSCFVAPETKSLHATGGAIDALIYDQNNDCVMDFGTNDGLNIDLSEKCYPYHPDISNEAKKNRKLLIDLFLKEDFVMDIQEYWHFDYGNVNWAIGKKERHAKYDIIKFR